MGCIIVLGIIALSSLISGAFVWLAFLLLHMVFVAVPVLTLWQAVIIGIVLGILGSFFKSNG